MLISNSGDFKQGKLSGIRGNCITIEGSVLQEHLTVLNVYVPSNRVSNYVRQKRIELQKEVDEFTIRDEDFNTRLSEMDRFSRQKISKNTVGLTTPSIWWN